MHISIVKWTDFSQRKLTRAKILYIFFLDGARCEIFLPETHCFTYLQDDPNVCDDIPVSHHCDGE